MANRILNAIFKADISDLQQKLKEVEGADGQPGSVGGLSVALNKASLLWAAYGTAAVLAGKAIGNEISEYSRYVTEVENLGYSLGLTAEEASYLVAAMGRYNITNDTMVAVFRKLASEGIDPTIEGLKELLEAWEAMPEGAAKGQFAMQMFGEQGIKQILPWWEKLNDEQRENFGLQENGLMVTEQMIAENYEFTQSVADLTDEWGNFKMELLDGVIPAITALLQLMTGKTADDAANFIKTVFGQDFGKIGSGLSSTPTTTAFGGQSYTPPTYKRSDLYPGHAAGGSFIVGGAGGSDTTPVNFMATPGETVTVGGGTNDNQKILAEMRRLVNTLPTAIVDAMERR